VSGTPVVIGPSAGAGILGVPGASQSAGLFFALHVDGIYMLPIAAAEPTLVDGAVVYWNYTTNLATATATGAVKAGVACYGGSVLGAVTCPVRLNGIST
jgi:predicted RecA/RadA family phage recombinase